MSTEIKDGGAVYPVVTKAEARTEYIENERYVHVTTFTNVGGMTLRDWLAGQALSGLLCNDAEVFIRDANRSTRIAYRIADAMLAAREVRP